MLPKLFAAIVAQHPLSVVGHWLLLPAFHAVGEQMVHSDARLALTVSFFFSVRTVLPGPFCSALRTVLLAHLVGVLTPERPSLSAYRCLPGIEWIKGALPIRGLGS